MIRNAGPTATIILHGPGAFRRLFETALIFFCSILFLRCFAVEPFGVPTGSMASTLIGNHKTADCPRCGFPVRFGEPGPNTNPDVHLQAAKTIYCPNCGATGLNIDSSPMIPGDRLLVDKNVYHLRSPRRWEIAVVRCQDDDGAKPYVKRVVGLPGESLFITQGDVHINGELARKSLDQALECKLLVFDPAFAPQLGWKDRWVIERSWSPDTPGSQIDASDSMADVERIFREGELHLDATMSPTFRQSLIYRNWNLDRKREEVLYDSLAYNVTAKPNGPRHGVTDFLVEMEVEIVRGNGSFWCQLTDGSDLVRAECNIGSKGVSLIEDRSTTVRTNSELALQTGKRYRIILAFVDRRVSLSIDGREPFACFDLPQKKARTEVSRPFRIGVQGASVVVRDLKLYRDIFYVAKGVHAVNTPYTLGIDEFFLLGDNSANSHDSRFWKFPGVPESCFLGKPFLLHQPTKLSHSDWWGNPREANTLDWGRIRWIR